MLFLLRRTEPFGYTPARIELKGGSKMRRREFLKTAALASASALVLEEAAWGKTSANAREYHVAADGNDKSYGSKARPFRTISAAAAQAQPGDVITVHKGVYRERIDPPRGGSSAARRIVYRAAAGEQVEITGAEIVSGWVKQKGDVWTVNLPNTLFGAFNPYSDLIHGDWFYPRGRQHHTGAVYLNGEWLAEAATLENLYAKPTATPLWFGRVETEHTTLWAQFPGIDPNRECTEINVRQSVFYPSKPGRNFITVKGFILRRAATPWAPPTAEQIGLIGTHWSKGWIIENNVVSHSACAGISLGKYGDEFDNTSQDSAKGYVKTIERAIKRGWSKENIGSHLVRGNRISHCEQAGIVGSLGCAFSKLTGNVIQDIHVRELFDGAEMAGIKFHGAVDTEISHNRIAHTTRGIWLDWLAQGAHVHRNLLRDNKSDDMFMEVDHGPFLIENNFFFSTTSQTINSQGGAYAHNLFCGRVDLIRGETRLTPFLEAHSTRIAGLHGNPVGDMRFYNNIFAEGGDLSAYDEAELPMHVAGNVFLKNAKACEKETAPLIERTFDPAIHVVEEGENITVELTLDPAWAVGQKRQVATTALLGTALISALPFELEDGAPVLIDKDFSGRSRNSANPFPGPVELLPSEKQLDRVRILASGMGFTRTDNTPGNLYIVDTD
jgi:alpha-N-arabinofuranosidase